MYASKVLKYMIYMYLEHAFVYRVAEMITLKITPVIHVYTFPNHRFWMLSVSSTNLEKGLDSFIETSNLQTSSLLVEGKSPSRLVTLVLSKEMLSLSLQVHVHAIRTYE